MGVKMTETLFKGQSASRIKQAGRCIRFSDKIRDGACLSKKKAVNHLSGVLSSISLFLREEETPW